MKEGVALAEALGIPADVLTCAKASDDPEGFAERLLAGRSQILLAKQTDLYGHFFACCPRAPDATGAPTDIEVFDSQATDAQTVPSYLLGTEGGGLNGEPADWLGRVLLGLKLDRGISLSFNCNPSQPSSSEGCLLHCLARSATLDVSPAEFTKKAYAAFS